MASTEIKEAAIEEAFFDDILLSRGYNPKSVLNFVSQINIGGIEAKLLEAKSGSRIQALIEYNNLEEKEKFIEWKDKIYQKITELTGKELECEIFDSGVYSRYVLLENCSIPFDVVVKCY